VLRLRGVVAHELVDADRRLPAARAARPRSARQVGADLGEASGEESALDIVAGEGERLLVRDGGLASLAELAQEVGAAGADVAVGGSDRLGQEPGRGRARG